MLERKDIEITRVISLRLLENFHYFGLNFGSEFISRLPLGTTISAIKYLWHLALVWGVDRKRAKAAVREDKKGTEQSRQSGQP